MNRLRNVCFTWNNYDDTSLDAIKARDDVTYAVYGFEVGENGTPHIQGYLEFKTSVRFTTLQKVLGNSHMEKRRGTAKQAADYCKKDGKFEEYGTLSSQGKRTDLYEVAEMVNAGSSIRDVALTYPVEYIRFHKGIEKYKAITIEPRNEVPNVIVLYGSSGMGKSRQAREYVPGAYVHHPQQGMWFDGYEGQTSVIFEEFRGQLPFGMLLSLLDRYDCKVQFKGGMIEFCATKIVITSPVHPREWYSLEGNDKINQLLRRITEIKCLGIVPDAVQKDHFEKESSDF